MKTGHLAKRLNQHPNTMRAWARDYAEFLSDRANAARRDFSEDDALVMATIAELREQGLLHEQIEQALRTGRRADTVPELPTPEEVAARERVSLVPSSEYERAVDRLQSLQGELEQARSERDRAIERWQEDTNELNERIADLEHKLGTAEGELKRVTEGLQGQINRLESERPSVNFWLAVIAIVAVVVAVAVYVLTTGAI